MTVPSLNYFDYKLLNANFYSEIDFNKYIYIG